MRLLDELVVSFACAWCLRCVARYPNGLRWQSFGQHGLTRVRTPATRAAVPTPTPVRRHARGTLVISTGGQDDNAGGSDDKPTKYVCGNGELEPGEFCDDGNTADDDGCSGDCATTDPDYDCQRSVKSASRS